MLTLGRGSTGPPPTSWATRMPMSRRRRHLAPTIPNGQARPELVDTQVGSILQDAMGNSLMGNRLNQSRRGHPQTYPPVLTGAARRTAGYSKSNGRPARPQTPPSPSGLKHDDLAFGLTRIFNGVCRNRLLHYGRPRPSLPGPSCDPGLIKAAQSAIHWIVDSAGWM